MPTVNKMEIEGTLYDIEDTEARTNASEVPAMEIRLQDVEEKANANETAIGNLAQSVPVAQYAAGSTDIESFSISGAAHALRDTAARALLVPATTAKTGLVKPDGSTITIDLDGTIHAAGGGAITALTQAQYDALTAEQKMNGTLYLVSKLAPVATDWLLMGQAAGGTEVTAIGNAKYPAVGAISAHGSTVYAGYWINTLTNVSTVFSEAEARWLAAVVGKSYTPATSQTINGQNTPTSYIRWTAPKIVDYIGIDVQNFPTITYRASYDGATVYLFAANGGNYIIRNEVRYS